MFCIYSTVASQCIPPSADSCQAANIFCSLDEITGYCCSNSNYANLTGCFPLCPAGGGPHNTQWWAFVTQGGQVSVTITYSNCSVNASGVQMGIWGDCSCHESIICSPACNGPGSYSLSGNLTPCKVYYFFVDGCNGDVCDFCITTTSQTSPKLPELNPILGPDEISLGNFGVKYTSPYNSNCVPNFQWTINQSVISDSSNTIYLSLPDTGTFVLCLIAYLGNNFSSNHCDIKGPECKKIKVINKSNDVNIIITPNGDGFNDFFSIIPEGRIFNLYIYDKWNNLVYQINDYNNDWNGTNSSNHELPNGIYAFIIESENHQLYLNGTITLIR